MAYLKRKHVANGIYLYIVRAYRRQGKVKEQVLEYLGNEAKVEPVRLKRALTYWRVKAKPAKGKGR